MTINGGSAWATSSQSNKVGCAQSQSGVNSTDSTDNFTSMMKQMTDMLVSTLDTNKDGAIDKTEFSQASQALSQKTGNTYDANSAFSAIDKNGDQSMSVDELLNALKQSQGKHGHGNQHKTDSTEASEAAQQQLSQATTAPDDSSSSKIQSALLQRILSAYSSNSSTATASTTLTMA